MFHRNKEKLESFIGANSNFKGDINTKGTLRIDGNIEGNVNADWVILSEKGVLKGDVTARGIVIGGRIEGNLKAEEIVEIKSKGQVYGDIFANKLSIIEGGIFNGRASVERDESKVVELQVNKRQ
ncbi:MAG: bactofilin family protein [Thermodesulfovibrionales bacterium]